MHWPAFPLLLCALLAGAHGADLEQSSRSDYPGSTSDSESEPAGSATEALDSVLDRLQMEIQTVQPVRTHVFWHIGNGQAQKGQRDQIVRAQLAEIQSSKLHRDGKTPVHFVVNTNQLSEQTLQLLQTAPGFAPVPKSATLSAKPGMETYEFPTLSVVHDHCSNNPNDMVAYIHSKSDDFWRRELQKRILDEYETCLSNMEQGVATCGPRYSRGIAGWCHYSGNFWWARCDHVKRLAHPYSKSVQEDLAAGRNFGHDWPPYGRYVAEYWLLNGMDPETPHTRPPQLPYPSSFIKDKCTPVKAFVQTVDPTHGMNRQSGTNYHNNFVQNLEQIRLAELATQLEETSSGELGGSLVTYDLSLESAISRYEQSLEMVNSSAHQESMGELAMLAANAQAEAEADLEAKAEAASNPVTRFISKDPHAVGKLQWSDKDSINGKNVDSTYGEWTVEGEKKWLQTLLPAHESDLGKNFEKADFWDFGSGRGLATLGPWFDFNFQNAYGVEAVDVRFEFACSVLEQIQQASQTDQVLAARMRGKQQRSVNFYHSDFDSFQHVLKGMKANPAVAWSSSLCFGANTLKDLAKLVALLPHKSLLATTSALLDTNGFKSLGEGHGDMSWSTDSIFHLYQKEPSTGELAQPSFKAEEEGWWNRRQPAGTSSDAAPQAHSKREMCSLVVPVGNAPLKFEKLSLGKPGDSDADNDAA